MPAVVMADVLAGPHQSRRSGGRSRCPRGTAARPANSSDGGSVFVVPRPWRRRERSLELGCLLLTGGWMGRRATGGHLAAVSTVYPWKSYADPRGPATQSTLHRPSRPLQGPNAVGRCRARVASASPTSV